MTPVERAAELIAVIYQHSVIGEPFHIELDDGNVDRPWEPWWNDGEDNYHPDHRAAAAELAGLIPSMSVSDRRTAIATYWRRAGR